MSNIQNVDSAPDYIMKFIHMNMEQLCKIYDEGIIFSCVVSSDSVLFIGGLIDVFNIIDWNISLVLSPPDKGSLDSVGNSLRHIGQVFFLFNHSLIPEQVSQPLWK